MADRRGLAPEQRDAIAEAMAAAGRSGSEGHLVWDQLGPALYRTGPEGDEAMALACLRCGLITFRPGSPRLPRFTAICSHCNQPWALLPPPAALKRERQAGGRSGLVLPPA